jgi:pSer/pThr/pTyr-binding forkhead associated (FHA) protein
MFAKPAETSPVEYQLIALTEGPNVLLDKPILLVGRHAKCDIQIDSRQISRHHCCIVRVTDFLAVRDLGSTNGIRLNGVRVREAQLKPGDELTIGDTRFRVRFVSDGEGTVLVAPAAVREARAEMVDDHLHESPAEPIPLENEDGGEASQDPGRSGKRVRHAVGGSCNLV